MANGQRVAASKLGQAAIEGAGGGTIALFIGDWVGGILTTGGAPAGAEAAVTVLAFAFVIPLISKARDALDQLGK